MGGGDSDGSDGAGREGFCQVVVSLAAHEAATCSGVDGTIDTIGGCSDLQACRPADPRGSEPIRGRLAAYVSSQLVGVAVVHRALLPIDGRSRKTKYDQSAITTLQPSLSLGPNEIRSPRLSADSRQ